jgi:hypothetical protein
VGTAPTHTAPIDWELLHRFGDVVRRRYPDARLLLFGSRARGEGRADSDYDLIIISSAFVDTSPLWRGQGLAREWAALLPPVDLDILCATPDEYERARRRATSWISEADREAVPL